MLIYQYVQTIQTPYFEQKMTPLGNIVVCTLTSTIREYIARQVLIILHAYQDNSQRLANHY